MMKTTLLCCCLFFFACKNQSNTPATDADNTKTKTSATQNAAATNDDMEFLSGCVDNAKQLYSEADAFVLCKCMLGQVKEKYPNADSATIMQHFSDSTEVKKMVQKCK